MNTRQESKTTGEIDDETHRKQNLNRSANEDEHQSECHVTWSCDLLGFIDKVVQCLTMNRQVVNDCSIEISL